MRRISALTSDLSELEEQRGENNVHLFIATQRAGEDECDSDHVNVHSKRFHFHKMF